MMKAMIFAAGLGTRLQPLTNNLPKALAPIAGKTLLYYVVDKLKRAGYDDIIINVHHFADKILNYVVANRAFGCTITFSDETDLLRDTGGGIRYAKELLIDSSPAAAKSGQSFLVHNVDIISDLDLAAFSASHDPADLATLLVSQRKTQRYLLFDQEWRLVGWTNIATGAVKSPFKSLDIKNCHMAAFDGIHQISAKIFDAFDTIDANPVGFPLYNENGDLVCASTEPLGRCFPIMDFYLRACAKYPIRAFYNANLTMFDAGKPDTLKAAGEWLTC